MPTGSNPGPGRFRLLKKPKEERDPINSLTRSFKVLAGGAVLVVAFMAAGIITVVKTEDQEDRQEAAKAEVDRVDRSVEVCLRDNRLTTARRELERDRVPQYAISFFEATPEQAQNLVSGPGFESFEQFIIEHLPYRQCSRACVIADLDPELDNCGPASNEQGDP